jgi:hypothetical protein
MVELPELPRRIARLRKDERGYPIPWFVMWMKEGQRAFPDQPGAAPDFRIIDTRKMEDCFRRNLCWICGDTLGRHRVFAIGPMCAINRVTSEPPSHRDCAEFAVKACPFLIRPQQKRNWKDLPENRVTPGVHIDRNPGCICLYETADYSRFETFGGRLIQLGKPTRVDWWAEGKPAVRKQVIDSIESGYPLLMGVARAEGHDAVMELVRQKEFAMELAPR